MRVFEVQVETTERDKWQQIEAETVEDAICRAMEKVKKAPPAQVFVVLAKSPRHENGAPIAVRRYSVEVAKAVEA